jgi:hypothetical protein
MTDSYDTYVQALKSATATKYDEHGIKVLPSIKVTNNVFTRQRAETIEGLILSYDSTFRFATGDDGIETATATADDAQAFLALVIEAIEAK